MEKAVYDAAFEGDASTLGELLQEDRLILDKASLNCGDKSPLHIAAFLGHVDFVKAIVNTNSDMCLARDRDGRNPLHLAAIKGRSEVLQVLINARPLAARERTDGGGTIFHLCVKYNQVEALKMLIETLQDPQLLNSKNDEGMTILHLAICDKQNESIKYLIQNNIDLNTKDAYGNSGIDIILHGGTNSEIGTYLQDCGDGASRGKGKSTSLRHDIGSRGKWFAKTQAALMVVASLIATMAFQAGTNPAGGVWQDDFLYDSQGTPVPHRHTLGKAVMAYNNPKTYSIFFGTNLVALVSSLTTILLLISGLPLIRKAFLRGLMVNMWLAVTSIGLSYCISVLVVTPDHANKMDRAVDVVFMLWCGLILLLFLGNMLPLINRWWTKFRGNETLLF